MSGPLLPLLLLLLPPATGAGVLALLGLRPGDDRLAFWGWAWLAGSLAWAGLLFVALLLGLGSLPWLAGAGAVALVAGVWLGPSPPRPPSPLPPSAPSQGEGGGRWLRSSALERGIFWAVLALVLVIAADEVVRSDARAVVSRDEARIWAAKAKVLYRAGGFGAGVAEELAPPTVHHPDYPLLDPLLQLGAFAVAGEVLHVENRLPLQGLFLALLLATAGALRRRLRPAFAALLLFLLVTAPASRTLLGQANADHLVALGLLVALDGWHRFRSGGGDRYWRLFAVALAFLAWSKNEGLMLAALLGVVAVAEAWWRAGPRPSRRHLPWLLLPAAVVAAESGLDAFYGVGNDLVNAGLPARLAGGFLDRAPLVAGRFAEQLLLDPRATQLAFPLLALLLALFPRRLLGGEPGRIAALLAGALGVHFVLYTATPHDPAWHLATSLDRVLFQLLPAALLGVAAVASVVFPGLCCSYSSRGRS